MKRKSMYIGIRAGILLALVAAGACAVWYTYDRHGPGSYAAAILACHSENPSGTVNTPISNNSVQYVKDTTRLFINTPKSLYPEDILHSWTTVSGNATGGYISNGGLPGEAYEATPECWSTQVELDGNGEVDLRVKSVVQGAPDYFVRFIVAPS